MMACVGACRPLRLAEWRDLSGRRVLDAGCGTGTLAIELARRGAEVVAIDISPTLVALGMAWGAVIGLVGGLLPAVHAARLPVAQALRAA